jgi:Ca-activated chloride channel family protein
MRAHDAILDALLNGGTLSEDMLRRLAGDADQASSSDDESDSQSGRQQIEALIQRIIERLSEQGFVSVTGPPDGQRLEGPGNAGGANGTTRFEVTDKAIDFLGYRALRDLLGSLGRSSVGRHDTRELATGIEAGGPPRAYEFGDTVNLARRTVATRSANTAAGQPAHLTHFAG